MTRRRPGTIQPYQALIADDEETLSPAEAALESRVMLVAAVEVMARAGFEHIRFDQWQHPKTRIMVETGYVYGESRLTVHDPDRPAPVDIRLTGRDQSEYSRFKQLAGV